MRAARARRPSPPHPPAASAAAAGRPSAGAPHNRPASWLPRRLHPPALLRLTRRPPLRLGGWLSTDPAATDTDAAAADGLTGAAACVASKPSSPAAGCGPGSQAAVSGPADSGKAVILSRAEAPLYLHRAGILGGYRVGGTHLSAFPALFTPHNEAGNVWTMLVGLAVATVLYASAARALDGVPATALPPLAAALPCGPLLPFRLVYGAVVVHNPASVGLHLWIGRDAGSRRVWRTADVALIQVASVTLAVSLSMPMAVEVGATTAVREGARWLAGWPLAWWAWLAAVAMLFVCNVGSTMVIRRVWHIGKARLTRDMAVIVACYLVPMVGHAAWWAVTGAPGGGGGPGAWSSSLTPPPAVAREAAMWALVATASVGVGGLLYAKHWPELWAPGYFDVVGNSHQWMHVAAFVAHWAEWRFLAALLLPRSGGGAG
ncbi:hypothetical protein MMPV_003983 [Pyropia vietnamensis]